MSRTSRVLLLSFLALVFTALLAVAGCTGSATDKAATTKPTEPTGAATEQAPQTTEEGGLYTPAYQPRGDEVAIIKTSKGPITVKLYGKDAPIHVGNFVELAKKGFYDGIKFHRYEPGFVVQGGDPKTKEFTAEQVAEEVATGYSQFGTGGPGYVIKGEFDPKTNPNKHVIGALGMARTNDPDSAGSQFYFALQPLPQLDGSYTVFGQVTEGLEAMQQLRVGDEIISVELKNAE